MLPSLLHQRTEDPLNSLVSAPQRIWTVTTALWGIAAQKLLHISPHGNFLQNGILKVVIHIYSWLTTLFHGVYPIASYGLHESIINEWWIINLQSSILSPWLPCRNCFPLVLVARWRTRAFSQFCLQIALPYKKGNRKLIVPWSSFNTHRTTDNACACLLSH